MREILFKAKRVDNGEWVEGSLLQTTAVSLKSFIVESSCYTFDKWDWNECVQVDTETICQYTGLTDKNGIKIWENDIVEVYARGYHTICTVSWAETVAHFQLWQINTIPNTPTVLNLGNYDCEVLGNIFDNPELLREE